MKKNKILSLALLPLLGGSLLMGCANHTAAEINVKYNTMINSYIEGEGAAAYNNMFKSNTTISDAKIYKNYILYPVYSVEKDSPSLHYFATTKLATTKDSYKQTQKRFYMLTSVYQRQFSLIYNYYAFYSDAFFTNINSKNPDQKEVNSLYEKMYDLNAQIEQLNVAKGILEQRFNLYTADSNLLNAPLQAYNYELNKAMEKSLDFVMQFKDMHKKYFYGGEFIAEVARTQQAYNEALLYLAEFAYLDNIKSFEFNNNCDLNALLDNSGMFRKVQNNGPLVNGLFVEEEGEDDNFTDYSDFVKDNGSEVEVQNMAVNKFAVSASEEERARVEANAEEMNVTLESFKAFMNVYKKIYNKIDYQNWNVLRFESEKQDAESIARKESAISLFNNDVQKAMNRDIAKEMSEVRVKALMDAMKKLF